MFEVKLSIPDELSYQLVYRQERVEPFRVEAGAGSRGGSAGVAPVPDRSFVLMANAGDGVRQVGMLAAGFGARGAIKALLKLATSSRMLCAVVEDGAMVHHAWLTISRCRYYWVERGAVVFGPVRTAVGRRSRGVATWALQSAMNDLIARGHRLFYVDTERENGSMQRVIEKCGFGPPAAAYIRGPSCSKHTARGDAERAE